MRSTNKRSSLHSGLYFKKSTVTALKVLQLPNLDFLTSTATQESVIRTRGDTTRDSFLQLEQPEPRKAEGRQGENKSEKNQLANAPSYSREPGLV